MVTAEADGKPSGLTASSFTSVSLAPPLILVCVDVRADSYAVLRKATHFGVSILAEGQGAAAKQMSSKGGDKFDGLVFSRGEAGQLLLDGALAHLECRAYRVDDAGDHALVLGEVLSARSFEQAPMLYYRRQFCRVVVP